MLNKSTSHSDHVVQSGVAQYPIGFEFQYNGDDTPQIRVTIGAMVAEENLHFVITEDLLNIKLIPLEEEAPEDPNDYSWLEKWVGMSLVIERDIPFVQESDYQVGRISPERIEKDFDLSVMRDQEIRNQANKDRKAANEQIGQLRQDMDDEFAAVDSRFDFIQEQTDAKFAEVDSRIDDVQEQTDAKFAKTDIAISGLAVGVTANEAAIQEVRSDFTAADQSIRGDVNSVTAAVAKKQDKLTAGDNIVISGNVISAIGAGGGAGFDAIVVQELPAAGQKGVIYLVPKDGTAPDVYDEYVWVTATQTFESIGTTKVDLSGYLPLSGGEMTGLLTLNAETKPSAVYYGTPILRLKAETEDGTTKLDHTLSLTPGGILLANGLKINGLGDLKPKDEWQGLGDVLTPWSTVYAKKLRNGADINIPTEGGTLARLEDLANIDALPDQSGNAGKVLTTDGSTASWQEPQGGTKVIIREWEE